MKDEQEQILGRLHRRESRKLPAMKPNAPNDDAPRRQKSEITREIQTHERSEAFKDGLLEGLLDVGMIYDTKLLGISRLEKRRFPFFGKLKFYGYAALIEIPGGWYVEGRGITPRDAILAALNTPFPFRP